MERNVARLNIKMVNKQFGQIMHKKTIISYPRNNVLHVLGMEN